MGLLLATLPVYFQVHQLLKSWPINGGIIAMGALLIFLAIVGCYGSRKQHQIILFFVSFWQAICSFYLFVVFAGSLTLFSMC